MFSLFLINTSCRSYTRFNFSSFLIRTLLCSHLISSKSPFPVFFHNLLSAYFPSTTFIPFFHFFLLSLFFHLYWCDYFLDLFSHVFLPRPSNPVGYLFLQICSSYSDILEMLNTKKWILSFTLSKNCSIREFRMW